MVDSEADNDQVLYPLGYNPDYEPDPQTPTDYPQSTWVNPFAAQPANQSIFTGLTEGGEEVPEKFRKVATTFRKFEEATKIQQDTMEAIEFAAAYEMMTEDFGNTELQEMIRSFTLWGITLIMNLILKHPQQEAEAAEKAEREAGRGTSEEHLHAFTIAQGEVKEKKKNKIIYMPGQK